MIASFPPPNRNVCFAHIKSKECKKALESSKTLGKVRQKLQKISRKSNKSPKFKRYLKKDKRNRKLRVITLKQKIATRCTSTKIMFSSFLPLKPDKEIDPDAAKANIDAINSAMKSSLSLKKFKQIEITNKDVDIVWNVLPTLKILKEGLTRIGSEKYSAGSIVLLFLGKFLKFLGGDEEDRM
eukprot:CAMPEP_0172504760 /NCGR_PEP_ID=MMETSP1066-20121228/181048_1 /TAXON_ID=671091 /ORGANISM="Coscinodiscus wailesii, Strain CCMP2513" /LENGTH=182 /DNA_ID=CAMNT_0013281061 /DNA_START=872 /DNA_END=1420 /DNA_ORIENTATION=+